VWGVGLRVYGPKCRVKRLWFRVQGIWYRLQGAQPRYEIRRKVKIEFLSKPPTVR
jgi:hypothetical protein